MSNWIYLLTSCLRYMHTYLYVTLVQDYMHYLYQICVSVMLSYYKAIKETLVCTIYSRTVYIM